MKPLIFARGVVSTEDSSEFTVNFNPQGSELYFTRREGGDGRATIFFMRFEDGRWTPPSQVGFSGSDFDYHPCLSRDGKRLFFGSQRAVDGVVAARSAPSIWFVRRSGRSWGEPVHLGPLLADGRAEFLSITNQSTLYFGEWLNGQESSLHKSRFRGGGYPAPERLPAPVNGTASDAHPLIAPDESFVIFDSTRPGGRGAGDLYLSFRRQDGSWTELANLGRKINTANWEVAPTLSHDGRYFFFHRNGNVFWVDAKALGIYRPLVTAHSDYDGDGTSDLAVFNPKTAKWKIRGVGTRKFGKPYAIAVPGDFDGDSKTDLAYFLPAQHLWKVNGLPKIKNFGAAGDIPVPGDYDGNGSTEIAFFRPYTGTWHFVPQAGDSTGAQASEIAFGRLGDLPVPSDYDGDGTTDIAVFRPSTRQWLIKGQGSRRFGKATDSPVPADYDGDGADDIAVWSPNTGKWSVRGGPKRRHGHFGAIPVPGDYDGNGTADFAYYDPDSRVWSVLGQFEVRHGAQGDIPLVLGH